MYARADLVIPGGLYPQLDSPEATPQHLETNLVRYGNLKAPHSNYARRVNKYRWASTGDKARSHGKQERRVYGNGSTLQRPRFCSFLSMLAPPIWAAGSHSVFLHIHGRSPKLSKTRRDATNGTPYSPTLGGLTFLPEAQRLVPAGWRDRLWRPPCAWAPHLVVVLRPVLGIPAELVSAHPLIAAPAR